MPACQNIQCTFIISVEFLFLAIHEIKGIESRKKQINISTVESRMNK